MKTAIAIADIFGSEIFLVNAVSLFVYGSGQEPKLLEMISAEIDSAKEEMKQIVASEPRLQGLRLKTTVAYAGAVDLIEYVASEEKVDLIVLGSHGSSGLEQGLSHDTWPTRVAQPSIRLFVQSHTVARSRPLWLTTQGNRKRS